VHGVGETHLHLLSPLLDDDSGRCAWNLVEPGRHLHVSMVDHIVVGVELVDYGRGLAELRAQLPSSPAEELTCWTVPDVDSTDTNHGVDGAGGVGIGVGVVGVGGGNWDLTGAALLVCVGRRRRKELRNGGEEKNLYLRPRVPSYTRPKISPMTPRAGSPMARKRCVSIEGRGH
jgi:hypothetical protein